MTSMNSLRRHLHLPIVYFVAKLSHSLLDHLTEFIHKTVADGRHHPRLDCFAPLHRQPAEWGAGAARHGRTHHAKPG
jgi:hypothetical protein